MDGPESDSHVYCMTSLASVAEALLMGKGPSLSQMINALLFEVA